MPRKTVTQLYAEFKKACAALDDCAYPKNGTREKEWNAAVDLATDLCERIVKTPENPADSIPEMLLKIDAADWSEGHVDGHCLASLRKDLEAMRAATPRATKQPRRPARAAAAL